ncbi:PilZ domain-containing protein [Pedomonas mirosovicensis]|uniref:PilZ domain-containing protein n=1 Tax=Pedomonas mirosovicensis TaxID=2908641 RepID=UPI00216815B5|nr:PilZ domain-containing protein [Pedomonas mirosovicensis]MCH8684061.1 PilZ domain-containing protein [Pedomonas mirosovicensis]
MSDIPGMSDETEEQRRFRRRPVLWKGYVQAASHRFTCLVRNVTPGGMLVELDLSLATGVALQVVLPDIRPLMAKVAWSSGVFHGLSFTEPEAMVRAAFGKRAESLGFRKQPQDAQP